MVGPTGRRTEPLQATALRTFCLHKVCHNYSLSAREGQTTRQTRPYIISSHLIRLTVDRQSFNTFTIVRIGNAAGILRSFMRLLLEFARWQARHRKEDSALSV